MICPGFRVKGLLRLFRLARVTQEILYFWLRLKSVSPFSTSYSMNSGFGLLTSTAPSTSPSCLGVLSLLAMRLIALMVRPMARSKQTIPLILRIWFLEWPLPTLKLSLGESSKFFFLKSMLWCLFSVLIYLIVQLNEFRGNVDKPENLKLGTSEIRWIIYCLNSIITVQIIL